MVLNTDLKEIMMDHALRTISYIADIGTAFIPQPTQLPFPILYFYRGFGCFNGT